jgi:hypothetical protein
MRYHFKKIEFNDNLKCIILTYDIDRYDSEIEQIMGKFKEVDIYETGNEYQVEVPMNIPSNIKIAKDEFFYALSNSDRKKLAMATGNTPAMKEPYSRGGVDPDYGTGEMGYSGLPEPLRESLSEIVSKYSKKQNLCTRFEYQNAMFERYMTEYIISKDKEYLFENGRLYEKVQWNPKSHHQVAKESEKRSETIREQIINYFKNAMFNAMTNVDDRIGKPLINSDSINKRINTSTSDNEYTKRRRELMKQYGKVEGLSKSHELTDDNIGFIDAVILNIIRVQIYNHMKEAVIVPIKMKEGSVIPKNAEDILGLGQLNLAVMNKDEEALEKLPDDMRHFFYKFISGPEFKSGVIMKTLKAAYDGKGADYIPSKSEAEKIASDCALVLGKLLSYFYFLTEEEIYSIYQYEYESVHGKKTDTSDMKAKPVKKGFMGSLKTAFGFSSN